MLSGAPEDPERTATSTLTPESPKPQYYPSPSNIPILSLEKQMDPMLGEPAISTGTPAPYHSHPHQAQTPSANSTIYHSDAQPTHNFHNAAASSPVGTAPAAYSQSTGYNGASDAQLQGTGQMHNYSAYQASNPYSDAQSAPSQDNRSAYQYAHDASAYAPQPQAAQGDPSQPPSNAASVDVQALLDQLSTPANNGIPSQYAAPPMPHQPAQSHGNSPTTSLPAAPSLPPRPPPQAKGATNPNYNPHDDIRSYHPHSAHRGSAQVAPINVRGGAGDQQGRSNLSPSTPGYPQRNLSDQARSEEPDDVDEDQRWPPEINRIYEEFLNEERKFVTEGQWEKFPYGSRLFIGEYNDSRTQ
jgi:hypothetical protein